MLYILPVFFQMLIGHAVSDFVLQPDAMGFGKNRNNDAQRTKGALFPHWYYWMTSHALVHGGAIYLITGNALLGLVETVLHWCIDFGKCERWFNVHVDQALHILCKILYCVLIVTGIVEVSLLGS